MKKKDEEYYFLEVLKLVKQLHDDYPSFSVARNVSTATSDYGDIWSMSNKELFFALEKYRAELELDQANIVSDEYVEKIRKDAENLDDILKEEDDGDF